MTRVQRVALGVGARSRPSTYRGRKARFCNILCLRGQIAVGCSCNINMYVGGGRRSEGGRASGGWTRAGHGERRCATWQGRKKQKLCLTVVVCWQGCARTWGMAVDGRGPCAAVRSGRGLRRRGRGRRRGRRRGRCRRDRPSRAATGPLGWGTGFRLQSMFTVG